MFDLYPSRIQTVGIFSAEVVVNKTAQFTYRKRLTAKSKQLLERSVRRFIVEEKLTVTQLMAQIPVIFDNKVEELWHTSTLMPLATTEPEPATAG